MTTGDAPRTGAALKDWRWCRAKDAPEVWEDGNGCLWCTDDAPGDHLLLVLAPVGDQ